MTSAADSRVSLARMFGWRRSAWRSLASVRGFANDLDALRDEVRTVVPVVVGTMIAVALRTREKRLMSGLKLLWRLL